MKEMGKYCKAYLLKDLRQFSGWTEKSENAQKETTEIDGQKVERARELNDDAILYLHEDYIVTDGIFRNENIIFDNVTPEWIEYCQQTLKFEVPNYEPINLPDSD